MFQPEGANPICVFCASSPGKLPVYTAAAESVGKALAESGRPLVYGGGVRGLMGVVSSATLKAGGRSHGIIPRALTGRAAEIAVDAARADPSAPSTPITEGSPDRGVESKEGRGEQLIRTEDNYEGRFTTETVKTMHERKLRMAQMSTGGFVVLPGGFGTFEELMEMVTWNQLGIHRLPVVVLNVNDFYTPLLQQVRRSVEEGFIEPINYSLLKVVDLQDGDDETLDWGKRCIEALDGWVWEEKAGYGLQWETDAASSK